MVNIIPFKIAGVNTSTTAAVKIDIKEALSGVTSILQTVGKCLKAQGQGHKGSVYSRQHPW